MTQATFVQALRRAVPDLTISDEPPSDGPTPDGHTPIAFHMRPSTNGVRLSIKIGEGRPYRFEFSSEEEAAEFVGRLCAVTKLP